ncbi:MAG: ribose ABC transporter substrate-binding protein RbsB [Roseiarcus sp.]|jgi:ribose transport system substrate-binding protein
MRKFLGVALAAIIAAGATTAAHAADKLALVLSTLNNPFFVTLKDGAAAKAKELGYDLVVLDSQNDPAKELSNVEDVLNQNVKLVMLNPADSDAAKSSVLAANHKNVPVITLDRSANGGDVVTHIASDNVAGGRMAADLVIKKLGGKGKVVELEGVPGASAARDRGKGFGDELATAPGIKIIASQTANFDRTQGLNVMENILQAQPDIDAVFAQNDEMALGAVKAIQAANRKMIVVGFDATDDARAAIKAGAMYGTIAQQPAMIGSLGVEAADKVLKGQSVPKFTGVPLQVVGGG